MPLMLTPEGVAVDVPVDQAQRARDIGYKDATPAQAAADLTRPESSAAGLGGAALAGVTAGLSGATLGLSDALIDAAAPRGDVRAVREAREAHPVVSVVGNVAGALAPALLTGGESLLAAPTRFASSAGRAAAEAGEVAGLGRIGGAAIGGAVEGGIYGAGQGVSELALSDDPLTVERIGSTLSTNILYGGALGAPIGALGKAAELGLRRAKGMIDDALVTRAAKAKTPAEAIESGDLELLDARQLKAARDAEIEVIRAGQRPEREAFVAEVRAARAAEQEAEPWRYSRGHADPEIRGLGKEYFEADIKIRQLLKNEKGLVENPGRALDALQRQEQALDKLYNAATAESERWTQDLATARARIRQELDAPNPKTEAWQAGERGPFTEAGKDAAVEREFGRRYAERPERLAARGEIGNALFRNRKLQQRLEALSMAPTSERLTKIDDAFAVLAAPKSPSLGQAVFGAVAPFAGPLGVAAAAGNRAIGGFRKIAGAVAERTGRAVSTFLDTASKAAAETTAPTVAAVSALAQTRFGKGPGPKSSSLPDVYAARTAELRRLTQAMPDGSIQMRPDARMAITRQLAPVLAVQPVLADRIETAVARRIAYMSSKIPKHPEVGGIQVGPDNWRPSELAMRSWARTVRACEDPSGVEERLAHGTITPEDAEAYRTCFPARFLALQGQVLAALPTLSKTLSTKKKVALFTLTGIPTMPALQPNVLKVLQATFAVEPGTRGGTQAPQPMPAFGAMGTAKTMDQPTPAQQRAG